MIIFYDKSTGRIVGSINGMSHTKEEFNMWVGNKHTTDRLEIYPGDMYFEEMNTDPRFLRKYKVNLITKRPTPIMEEEQ